MSFKETVGREYIVKRQRDNTHAHIQGEESGPEEKNGQNRKETRVTFMEAKGSECFNKSLVKCNMYF